MTAQQYNETVKLQGQRSMDLKHNKLSVKSEDVIMIDEPTLSHPKLKSQLVVTLIVDNGFHSQYNIIIYHTYLAKWEESWLDLRLEGDFLWKW